MDYRSQIELPIAANHAKSSIRKQEFDQHHDGDQHIQNDGLPGQMLVMTAIGPRMMTPKLQCVCGGSHYGCDCRIVFDDTPPSLPADVSIRCFKNGNLEVPVDDTISLPNIPGWTLESGDYSTFFRFVPEKVFDGDLSQLNWSIVDNIAGNLSGTHQMIGGKRCFDLYADMTVYPSLDDHLMAGVGSTMTGMMRLQLRRTTPKVKQIVCGSYSAWFLFEDGTVWSCGNNDYGQLGRNVANGHWQTGSNLGKITGLPTGAGNRVVQIAATDTSFFAVLANGDVWCAGENTIGQLGYTKANGSATATNLARNAFILNVKSVFCGRDFTYFLSSNGDVRSCGNNGLGQLGRITAPSGNAMIPNLGLVAIANVKGIACGDDFTWFQVGDNDVWTCGSNFSGQLARGSWATIPMDATPTFAWSLPMGIIDMSCGVGFGYVTTGGRRAFHAGGSPGGGTRLTDIGLSNVDQAVASTNMTYSLFIRSGKTWVQGANSYGQLGIHGNPQSATLQMTDVLNGNGVRAFTGGTACYWILPGGDVMAVGNNRDGHLGFTTPASTQFYGVIDFK